MSSRFLNLVRPLRLARRRQQLGFLPGRLYSTVPQGATAAASRSSSTLAVVGLSLGLGALLGYYGPKLSSDPSTAVTTVGSKFGSVTDFKAALGELTAAFEASQLSTDPDVLVAHGTSTNHHHPSSSHSVVIYPRSTEDVVKLVNISRKWRIPITPYSGGTSLEGHTSGVGLISGN